MEWLLIATYLLKDDMKSLPSSLLPKVFIFNSGLGNCSDLRADYILK